jgi:hypothetical protein
VREPVTGGKPPNPKRQWLIKNNKEKQRVWFAKGEVYQDQRTTEQPAYQD